MNVFKLIAPAAVAGAALLLPACGGSNAAVVPASVRAVQQGGVTVALASGPCATALYPALGQPGSLSVGWFMGNFDVRNGQLQQPTVSISANVTSCSRQSQTLRISYQSEPLPTGNPGPLAAVPACSETISTVTFSVPPGSTKGVSVNVPLPPAAACQPPGPIPSGQTYLVLGSVIDVASGAVLFPATPFVPPFTGNGNTANAEFWAFYRMAYVVN